MHFARKRFGQHFLHDPGVIAKIVGAIDPRPEDRLVEIGPGLGAITMPLLARVNELHAIEIDRDAIRHLHALAAGRGTLHIHEADVLRFDLASLRNDARRLRIVGNLPYNISTPLLFRLIEQREHLADLHVMLQKEVIERMAAGPNTEHYGRLSVMLAPWLRVEPLFDIGPGAFKPAPRVVSTFARLTPHASPPISTAHPREYAAVVAAAFSQRRKTLRNALKALLTEREIAAAGIEPGVRAETVSPAGYARLAAQLAAKSSTAASHGA
jgi:16S rRNA (adenine1518-N6/adenine1519-N6)-dimethyltransferase